MAPTLYYSIVQVGSSADMVSKVKLVATFIGYLNTRNAAGLRSIFSSDFVQLTRPATLGAHPIGRDEYIQQFLSAPVKYINVSLAMCLLSHMRSDATFFFFKRCRYRLLPILPKKGIQSNTTCVTSSSCCDLV